jgi:hypothetical protein
MRSKFSGLFGSSYFESTPMPLYTSLPATIDLSCPCGAKGRGEANSLAGVKAIAAQFYEAHKGHVAPASTREDPS